MDGKMIGIRMHQIIAETGMHPKDFFEINGIEDGHNKFTRSNFYNYYSGKVKKPSIEYVELFCKIADVPLYRFFQEEVDEFVVTDEEKQVVILTRQLTNDSKSHLKSYIQFLADKIKKK